MVSSKDSDIWRLKHTHRTFVRENCWLVNLKGGEEDWSAIDLVEERTVRDVKVTYRPRGPNQSWDLMKERAPAIPTLRVLDEDMSRQFRTIYRGTSHTSPSKDADVQHLDEHYKQARIHVYTPGRLVTNTADKVKEFVSDGYYTAYTKTIPKWVARRAPYERNTSQVWPESAEAQVAPTGEAPSARTTAATPGS